MLLEERLEQIGIGDDLRIEDHHHRLGMTGLAGTDLVVGRIRGIATHVPHRGGIDARKLPEEPLRAPEAPEPEIGDLQIGRERSLNAAFRAPSCVVGMEKRGASLPGSAWSAEIISVLRPPNKLSSKDIVIPPAPGRNYREAHGAVVP